MMERAKSLLLFLLVAASLVQSYFLAYNMPNMEAKEKTELDYVAADPLGPEEQVENLLFPEELVVHMGGNKHTVFYPNDNFYNLVLDKLSMREFKGFQQDTIAAVDWDEVRQNDLGIEVRFGRAVPFELLQKVFKIDSNFLFSADSISRIWIFARQDREEVRTFFFSADGRNVYEALRADLTVQDVQQCVGFGQYWIPFSYWNGGVYVPDEEKSVDSLEVSFSQYTPDQMQRNLFNDPGTTQMIQDREDGTRIYTDTKRALKIEQEPGWLSYTDPVAPTDSQNDLSDNIASAVQFVNEHGGWNGRHRLVQSETEAGGNVIRFQQYFKDLPILSSGSFRFGYMQLAIQQGTVASYERSMIVLDEMRSRVTAKTSLPGGEVLRTRLLQAAGGDVVEAIYPAYMPTPGEDVMRLKPVWAIRLLNGEVRMIG
ncbi:two-component system activity regulator YycH [Cohnella lubricantis]|uniref:Regulatory protein YycH domain-containing protein n=1 Tax=Cohnella lubricantis TaxID=2163172 RepID=A0A841TJX2_9BACL|nr:two-component system activity regulator YycH [Cohnella lubricantis]MBB6679518.1 hypothetical protein [Cohnella lubricantis]MBP2119262.1 regulatory protein YycH of two-component signal transduction system YycFG [Cohnella lubricantis]